ncbi:MAG: CHASE2 and HATPase_c domain-containing protein [Acidobacteria bacterium]|nr:CHASE2 and HATPase_c domain-containing protein [Acidobacteriota bacterium]MDA1234677.1 CHASE2 and HATPase_c domain-containing protein [Acidobacteriota bacterium]
MPSPRSQLFLAASAAFLAALLLSWSPVGSQFDRWAYDLLLRAQPPEARESRSVIVAIDEATLANYGGILGVREPLARALQILAEHQPSALALDIVLAERREEQADAELAAALGAVPNDVLAAYLRASGAGWEGPREDFAAQASAQGHVHAEPDVDGVCRRILLAKVSGRERLWAIALEAFRLSRGEKYIVETEDNLQVGDRLLPAPARSERELLIRYPQQPVERISMQRILEDPEAAEAVRGRAVFVGVLVLAGTDRYLMTPYSDGQPLSGVEINAAVYETLAAGEFLVPMGSSASLLTTILIAALLATILWFVRRAGTAWVIGVAVAALAAVQAIPWIAMGQDVVMPAAELLFPAWACTLASGALSLTLLRGRLDESERQKERYEKAVHYITHEMRTPLTAIQGSSELMGRYDLSEDKRKQMSDLILSESKRLAGMVDAFLNVESLAAGTLELKTGPVDSRTLLSGCIERVRPAAERKNIDVRFDSRSGGMIDGDQEFLEYACYNLLTNAVKYSPAQTAISVRAHTEGDRVLVSVEDQGYGMDEKDLQNIFRRFYRSTRAKDSGEAGVGVGLALVEEIVIQHGGTIQVESEVGRGSCFTISLPADAQDA